MKDMFGISDPTIQLAVLSSCAVSVAYAGKSMLKALNIDNFVEATTPEARETYAKRAGFADAKHLADTFPADLLRLKAIGYAGLVGIPVAMVIFIVARKMTGPSASSSSSSSSPNFSQPQGGQSKPAAAKPGKKAETK
jgi:hypothetical protein